MTKKWDDCDHELELSTGLHEGHEAKGESLPALNREHPAIQNMNVFIFFYFRRPFFALRIQIQPTKINADSGGSGFTTLVGTGTPSLPTRGFFATADFFAIRTILT
jgi:hypothetical protein